MGLAALAALAALAGVVWYYSNEIIGHKQRVPLETGLTVAAVDDTSITLAGSRLARTARVWFVEWRGGGHGVGYGVMWDSLAFDSTRVRRRFDSMAGAPLVGQTAALGAYLYESDPLWAYGMKFDEVYLSTTNGEAPAWVIPGARDTWVVVVHGKAAGRGQALRLLPTIVPLGLPVLVITYRNGPAGPRSADRLYHLGSSEWRDLEAAVRYALRHGARRVVLFGYSMGGSMVANFLDRSALADSVAGVVLDSPVLDWDATVRLAAGRRRVPALVTTLAERTVTLRIGFRWDGPEGKVQAETFRTPVLLFHGTADGTVPIAGSEAFAKALGDRVTFVPTVGAGHIQSWNFDPQGYERILCDWLTVTVGPPLPTPAR